MSRIYIDIGRDDGVRPADFVGAIANEAGVPGRAIGAIDLYERFFRGGAREYGGARDQGAQAHDDPWAQRSRRRSHVHNSAR